MYIAYIYQNHLIVHLNHKLFHIKILNDFNRNNQIHGKINMLHNEICDLFSDFAFYREWDVVCFIPVLIPEPDYFV